MTFATKPCPRCERTYIQPVRAGWWIRPQDWKGRGCRLYCIHCGLLGGKGFRSFDAAVAGWNEAAAAKGVG